MRSSRFSPFGYCRESHLDQDTPDKKESPDNLYKIYAKDRRVGNRRRLSCLPYSGCLCQTCIVGINPGKASLRVVRYAPMIAYELYRWLNRTAVVWLGRTSE